VAQPGNQVDIAQTIVNQFAMELENELVAARVVTSKKYDNEIDADNGLMTKERIPPRYVSSRTTGGVADYTSGGQQDSVIGSEIVRCNQVEGLKFGYDDFERIKSFSDAVESQALKACARDMAHSIDGRILEVAALAAYNWVGTPGNPITELDEFMSGYTRLKEEGVEDSDLFGVLSFTDKQKLQKYITELTGPGLGQSAAARNGTIGNLGGIPTLFTQQLPLFVSGTRVANTATVSGASQNVNYRDVAVATSQGYHNTQILKLNQAGALTLKKGDVLHIGFESGDTPVLAYDNRRKQSLGREQQFVVVEDVTFGSAGGNDANVRVAPAAIVPGSGSGTDPNVNTAHGTVTVAPQNTDIATFKTAAGASSLLRIIMQKNALLLSTAKLVSPKSDTFRTQTLSEVPIQVRMWWHSDHNTGKHSVRFDAAWDINVMDRRRIVRINGA
jgi:hypothetical protein